MRRYLLDTNILSDLVRNPQGRIASRIARIGEKGVCTSIVVAAELRYGAAKQGSARLSSQLETILRVLEILPLETPVDEVYGKLRADLERKGQIIGGNDLLIAAHTLALGHTIVTDNVREFSRIRSLSVENWLRSGS
jgi:tRNA(fMet)-specific endonuclease VapC